MSSRLTDEELRRLEGCQTEPEWYAACAAVKDSRGGEYPSDWWEKVATSGMARRVTERFTRPRPVVDEPGVHVGVLDYPAGPGEEDR